MRLNLHGELAKVVGGSTFEIQADTIADAIEGLSRQVNWPRDMRVVVVDHMTEESLYESAEEVDIMPSLAFGSGKFGTIILGAALIGAGLFTGGLTTAMGASLIISGSIMVLQGVMNLFMKSPKVQTSADPEASKYLSLNKNTTAVNTPITLAWGRIDLAGHWLSLQSDSNNLSHGQFPTTPT
jgi:predicted phage tail protein